MTITDKAATQIKEIMESDAASPQTFVRISVKGGGCNGLTYDIAFDDKSLEDDQFFEDKGIKLATDLMSYMYVCNSVLDYTEGLNGKGFHFKNPNAERTCACGESFSV